MTMDYTQVIFTLRQARKYIAKMEADNIKTVVPPSVMLRRIDETLGDIKD